MHFSRLVPVAETAFVFLPYALTGQLIKLQAVIAALNFFLKKQFLLDLV